MQIVCSEDELKELFSLGVLKVKSQNEYYIETKPDIRGESHIVLVCVSTDVPAKTNVLHVDDFIKAFPTPLEARQLLLGINGNMTRSLRTGVKLNMQKKLQKLSAKFTKEQIIAAVKYEVNQRVENSLLLGKNELQFMQAAGSWLNNDANIESIIEELGAVVEKPNNDFDNSKFM